jgi:TonB-linked SusC/RagA family outer membrane protein
MPLKAQYTLAENQMPNQVSNKTFSYQKLKKVLNDFRVYYKVDILFEGGIVQEISVYSKKIDLNLTLENNLDIVLTPVGLTYKKIKKGAYLILPSKTTSKVGSLIPKTLESIIINQSENLLKSVENQPLSNREKNESILRIIKGIVKEESGFGLPGVSILVKGTNQGTTTDVNGNYEINAPSNTSILVFSYVGYQSIELSVGNKSLLDVILLPEIKRLEEVMVTALGIKRSAKSLGYATASVSNEQISVNRTANFMNALQGKMAGVNITSMGSGPAGTSKIRIRGQSSFGGNNSPLIVVNGVPIDNTNNAARGDVSERGSNRTSDGGDGLSSINPDDIENMTVLKGAAASALYGSRAKDGVIMITTKNRGDGKGISLTFNSNFTSDRPLDYTDYQYEYGQGENGVRPTTPFPASGQWSFGEKFAPGMTQTLFNGLVVPYEPQRGIINQYYRDGSTFTNSLTLSSGGESGGFSLSVSNLDNKTILEGSGYHRKTVNLGFTQNMGKKLNVSGNLNYSNEYRKNPPNIAEQDYSPVVLYNMANSMPLNLLRENASDDNGNEVRWSRFTNRTNPFFALKRFDNIYNDRIFGNITARYNFTPWLFLQGRIGQDFYSREQAYNLPTGTQRQPAAPVGFVNGQFVQDARTVRELNNDFLIGANKKFGQFDANVNVGGNQMYRRISRNNVFVQDFYTRGLYSIANSRQRDATYDFSERKVNSLYASGEVSFRDYIFVNATARNDWFSTLSAANRSILYPSITTSFVFSQAFAKSLPSWITFGKIRAGYAEVGSDTDVSPYSNNLFYDINPQQFSNPSGIGQPLATISGSVVPNPNLRPMRVSEREFGLELKMLNNRLGVDLTYYNKLSSDQILRAQISDAGGFLTQLINVGESRNKGYEMLLNIVPIQLSDFEWNLSLNAAYNITKVLNLGSDVSDNMITVGTGDFTGELRQEVGKTMGQLYGFGYLRNEQGQQVFDAGNGRPLRTPQQISFGSAVPLWVGGIFNEFKYKTLNLSFLIDFKLGHNMISGTNFNAWRHGLHKETLPGREEGFVIGEGVNNKGETNTTKSGVQAFYETVRSRNIAEPFVYNAGLWQLRQINVGFDITKFIPDQVTFLKSAKLSFVANNVAVLKKWVPNIHPEQFGLPSDNLIGLEATGLPITRSLGFNLNAKF